MRRMILNSLRMTVKQTITLPYILQDLKKRRENGQHDIGAAEPQQPRRPERPTHLSPGQSSRRERRPGFSSCCAMGCPEGARQTVRPTCLAHSGNRILVRLTQGDA